MPNTHSRRRSRRRSVADTATAAVVKNRGRVTNPYQPFAVFSEDEIEAIHNTSLKLLCDIGINFQLPEAVEILRASGANVDDDAGMVRFDPDFVMEKIATAPSFFTIHARNQDNNVVIGGSDIVYALVGSPPNVSDINGGRRSGNLKDYENLLRLGQSLDVAQLISGYPVEPIDIEVRFRHLRATRSMVTLTDLPLFGYALGGQRMKDSIEMARIARGISREQLLREPSVHTVVNSNSPLIYDGMMLEAAMEMARCNQPVTYTPFTLAGAMAPITLPGALVQQNAEALAGVVFSQCVNPGAPVVYGTFTSNVDMKTGSPAFGTPEYAKATIASGQLARRYNLPLRASNATASNTVDAQAAYESQMSLWACMLGQVNWVNHGLGWLEGGLCASYEKFILDAEMIAMFKSFLTPEPVTEDTLALDAIAEVGPGNHFFGADHTIQRYKTAFYTPLLSDWQNFENWEDGGSVDATTRANKIAFNLIDQYQQPALDVAIKDELNEFIERREREGGVPQA